MTEKLRITEIFHSLQGEARTVGWPTVFVRLTGCPLRCGYCDTAYAFSGGLLLSIAEILATVASWSPRFVCVTGGEPLAQKSCWPLLTALCAAGYQVSLETSGAIDMAGIDSRNHYPNVQHLLMHDQVKFVICDEVDYRWAKSCVEKYALVEKVSDVLFSPSHATLNPAILADWILQDCLKVRMQVQLHKYLWADAAGR